MLDAVNNGLTNANIESIVSFSNLLNILEKVIGKKLEDKILNDKCPYANKSIVGSECLIILHENIGFMDISNTNGQTSKIQGATLLKSSNLEYVSDETVQQIKDKSYFNKIRNFSFSFYFENKNYLPGIYLFLVKEIKLDFYKNI